MIVITTKPKKTVRLGDVPPGCVFHINSVVYMKVRHVGLQPQAAMSELERIANHRGACVALSSGILYFYYDDIQVEPLPDAKIFTTKEATPHWETL